MTKQHRVLLRWDAWEQLKTTALLQGEGWGIEGFGGGVEIGVKGGGGGVEGGGRNVGYRQTTIAVCVWGRRLELDTKSGSFLPE